MTVKQAITVMGGVPKSELEDWIAKRGEYHRYQTSAASEAIMRVLDLLVENFYLDGVSAGVEDGDSPDYRPGFPLDAVLVNAEYVEVGAYSCKGAYGEVDIAGKPQEHLTTVDVFRRDKGVCGWQKMTGAKVVVVD